MSDEKVAFARGQIEGFLEDPTSGKVTQVDALEAWEIVETELKRRTDQAWDLAQESANQTIEIQNLKIEAAKKAAGDETWQQMTALDWDDQTGACFMNVCSEYCEPFGCGAVYLDAELVATLETPPFSVSIGLPYIRAIVKRLEASAHLIPTSRSGAL